MMSQFHFFHESEINLIFSKRTGETKLGEVVHFGESSTANSLSSFVGKYVIVGVSEDIGPQANLGRDGAKAGFDAFLSVWLNMQSNRFFDAKDCLVLGKLKVDSDTKDIEKLRSIVSVIDDELVPIFEKIFMAGKIPIVIGGGHNNAYPIIKAYHKVFQKKMKIVNLDPHADFRL
ncbi:MAG: arginase family protein, partial [Crocinitomicaceae bacterium]